MMENKKPYQKLEGTPYYSPARSITFNFEKHNISPAFIQPIGTYIISPIRIKGESIPIENKQGMRSVILLSRVLGDVTRRNQDGTSQRYSLRKDETTAIFDVGTGEMLYLNGEKGGHFEGWQVTLIQEPNKKRSKSKKGNALKPIKEHIYPLKVFKNEFFHWGYGQWKNPEAIGNIARNYGIRGSKENLVPILPHTLAFHFAYQGETSFEITTYDETLPLREGSVAVLPSHLDYYENVRKFPFSGFSMLVPTHSDIIYPQGQVSKFLTRRS